MSGKGKRSSRTRSSKQFCQEKFSCQGERTEAEYECDECGTLQCANCEAKLHELAKFVFHDRKRIPAPPPDKLCQLSCEDRNYADVRCESCAHNYCNECFDNMHAHGRRRSHKKTPLKEAKKLQPAQTEQPQVSARETFEPIKPLSPLSIDDQLTYFSMPQDEANMVSAMDRSDSSRPSIPDVAEVPDYYDRSPSQAVSTPEDMDEEIYKDCRSFLLADHQENLQIIDEQDFVEKIGCELDSMVKVVSIFGNTGDGKSYTLNHTFFGGREVFITSANQMSCTVGVWTAFDPVHNAVIVDTEGLLGVTSNQNQRTRLLLKVLAISDVVIYRTKADRLHNDMFHFLGDASKAYLKHFSSELRAASKRCKLDIPLSNLGPAVIVFHETQHTEILGKDSPSESAEFYLRKRFQDLNLTIDAFSSLQYMGTRTLKPPTDFKGLLLAVKGQLRNISVRSPRKPAVIYNALKVLNEKFSGDIETAVPSTFPDQYFTCTSICLSCGARCTRTMNHVSDDIAHHTDRRCKYQHQYDNRIFTCKACYDRGHDISVVPKTSSSSDSSWFGLAKYAWSGYVLECPNCGIIYRSRQFWYGNQEPEKTSVRTEIRHVWPGGNPVLQGTHNAARRLLDSLSYASETLATLSAKPAKYVGNWVTDQIAPPYWVPNALIKDCHSCKQELTEKETIHHCRACGHGFCDDCSAKRRPVPERGWGPEPVRVCDNCYTEQSAPGDPTNLRARKVGEVLGSTIGVVASAMDYPLDMLRESARPAYWVPDTEIKACCVCQIVFGPKLSIHHCRACGQGVCDPCSEARRAVPSRGWDHPVRVCKNCNKKKGDL